MRLPTLLGGGALGAALATSAPSAAHACHEERVPNERYQGVVNVGLTMGISFAPGLRVSYGADVRYGRGPAVAFARVELGNPVPQHFSRLTVGGQYVAYPGAAEAGLVWKGP